MLDFKKLLGDKYKDDLTADEKLALLNELNLADLSSGEYVAKGKFEAKEQDVAKLNKLLDEYRQKEKDGLSNEQKKDLEYQELGKRAEQLENELAEFKLKETIMTSGYSSEECSKIISAQKEGKNVAQVYAEIMNSRLVEKEKSLKAEFTKTNTPPAPQGSDGDDNDFGNDPILQMVSEAAKSNISDPNQIDKIKGDYSMSQESKN